MKHVLFSDDIALIQRWENIIGKSNVEVVDDMKVLSNVKDAIVIFNSSACDNNCDILIDTLVIKNNKILILDRVPDFYKAQKWLAKGIKGYGNAIMTSSYLHSAIEAISNGMIWLIPDITTAFVNHLVKKETLEEDKNQQIYDELTIAEQKIAKLLKEGYSNIDICEALDISLNTVKTHVKHIYKKLQVKDRISFSLLFNR